MQVIVNDLPRNQKELVIEVSLEDLKPFLETAAKELSQKTKIAGFRPGKASYEIVKQQLGEMALYQQAMEKVVNQMLVKAVKQEQLNFVGQPEIEVTKLAPGNPIEFKAKISLMPEVKLGDLAQLKVAKNEVRIEETDVEKVIKDLQRSRAKEALVDRPAKKTDRVQITFTVCLDKVPIENGQHKDYPVVIGEGKMIPGFEDQLVGMKANDKKEFTLTFPKEYHAKHLAGKECEFEVTMKSVYQIDDPELDDAFAKELKFDSMAKLKEQIKDNLTKDAELKEAQRQEQEMLDKIIEISTFGDVPDVLLRSETDRMLEEMKANLAQQGLEWQQYLDHLKKTEAQLKLDFSPQAIKRVKAAMLTREIAIKEKVEVDDKEAEAEIAKMKKAYAAHPEMAKHLEAPGYRDYLKNMMRNRKVIEFLKARIIDSAK